MDKLARISQATTHALTRLRGRAPIRSLRHACLAIMVAAPALGACPTLQRDFDGRLYDAALALVQSAMRDDDPWRAANAAAFGPADRGTLLDDRARPLYLAVQPAVPPGDAMDLLTVATAHAARAALAQGDTGAVGARTRGAMPSPGSPPRALFAMAAANEPSDDAPFAMPPGAPPALARPHPAAGAPPVSDVASDAVVPIPAPLVVLPVAGTPTPDSIGEMLLTSVPPVIPPVIGGTPPGTITPGSGPAPGLAPPPGVPGGSAAPPVVPPTWGGNGGDEGAARPGARPLPEPGMPWLVAAALALFAVTARRAPAARRWRPF